VRDNHGEVSCGEEKKKNYQRRGTPSWPQLNFHKIEIFLYQEETLPKAIKPAMTKGGVWGGKGGEEGRPIQKRRRTRVFRNSAPIHLLNMPSSGVARILKQGNNPLRSSQGRGKRKIRREGGGKRGREE